MRPSEALHHCIVHPLWLILPSSWWERLHDWSGRLAYPELAASPPQGERPEPATNLPEFPDRSRDIPGLTYKGGPVARDAIVGLCKAQSTKAGLPHELLCDDKPCIIVKKADGHAIVTATEPDDTTRPSMNVATPEAIDDVMNAVMAEALEMKRREVSAVLARPPEPAYVPRVGDPVVVTLQAVIERVVSGLVLVNASRGKDYEPNMRIWVTPADVRPTSDEPLGAQLLRETAAEMEPGEGKVLVEKLHEVTASDEPACRWPHCECAAPGLCPDGGTPAPGGPST